MTGNLQTETSTATRSPHQTGPWDAAVGTLHEWDPTWARACVKMTTSPWTHEVLPRKPVELVGVALNAASQISIQTEHGVTSALSIAFDASYTHMYAPVRDGTSRVPSRQARPWRKSWRC
ncbi:hypothetical protein ACVISU_007772 [Bradyrhizobium sp. USDA 4452]